MDMFDKKTFFFNDSRILYSINEIQTLVMGKITAPDSIIRISEDLAFRAGDVVQGATSLFHNLLNLAIDQPSSQS